MATYCVECRKKIGFLELKEPVFGTYYNEAFLCVSCNAKPWDKKCWFCSEKIDRNHKMTILDTGSKNYYVCYSCA